MKWILTAAIFVTSGVAHSAQSGLPPAQSVKVKDLYDAKVSNEVISRWARGVRKPANAGYGEGDLSESFKKIRTKILAAKNADDIDALLSELNDGYNELSNDSKYFAAQFLVAKSLRGIIWRMRPLFEQKGSAFEFFSGNPATHSAAVGILRSFYHLTKVYVPHDQGQALFDYFTVPSKNLTLADQFKTVEQFQYFLATDMYKSLSTADNRLKDLYGSKTTPYILDAKVFYGPGTFDDGIARYIGFDDAEVAVSRASLNGAMHSILVFCAYNQKELINVLGRMAKLYGIDGFSSENFGVTSKARRDVVWEFKDVGFLKIRSKDKYGQALMKSAYAHLVAHASYLKDAHDVLQHAGSTNDNVLNPMFFKPDAQPRLKRGVTTMYSVVKGRESVRSPVTGEVVVVDIPNFYESPPESMMDLLPTAFEGGHGAEKSIVNSKGETLVYRNYAEGRPVAWGEEWKKIFPNLSGKQTVSDAYRTIEYSTGAQMMFGPMSYFIF